VRAAETMTMGSATVVLAMAGSFQGRGEITGPPSLAATRLM
jgi:hypothetical protein